MSPNPVTLAVSKTKEEIQLYKAAVVVHLRGPML
jgi:hypothetical protein